MKDAGRYINVQTVMTLTVALSSTLWCVSCNIRLLIRSELIWSSMPSRFVSCDLVSRLHTALKLWLLTSPRVACTRCSRISVAFTWPSSLSLNSCSCSRTLWHCSESVSSKANLSLMLMSVSTSAIVLRRHRNALQEILSSRWRRVCRRSGSMTGSDRCEASLTSTCLRCYVSVCVLGYARTIERTICSRSPARHWIYSCQFMRYADKMTRWIFRGC